MKKVLKGFIVGIAGICLTGCGNAIPEMTQEQQELVVEYAAGELLKYDRNHVLKLVTLEEPVEEVGEEKETIPANDQTAKEEKPDGEEGVTADNVTVVDQTQQPVSMEEFLGLQEAEISYTGYEMTDSYPSAAAEEVYFFMEATQNHQLLVLKFDLKNTAANEQEIDLAAKQVHYRIVVDGSVQNGLTTMLLNDMAYYQGTLAPGESTELVVVAEMPADQTEQVTSLELIMRSVDDTETISLN